MPAAVTLTPTAAAAEMAVSYENAFRRGEANAGARNYAQAAADFGEAFAFATALHYMTGRSEWKTRIHSAATHRQSAVQNSKQPAVVENIRARARTRPSVLKPEPPTEPAAPSDQASGE